MSTPKDRLEELERLFQRQMTLRSGDQKSQTADGEAMMTRAELEVLFKKLEAERKERYRRSTTLTLPQNLELGPPLVNSAVNHSSLGGSVTAPSGARYSKITSRT